MRIKSKKERKRAVPCSVSAKILTYGFYLVLCQLILIILCMSTDPLTSDLASLFYTYRSYFDYPATCFAIIVFGSLLIDYVVVREDIEI